MASITSANTVFAVKIAGLIPAPVILQGYSADDIFDFEGIELAEVIMGVDGKKSAGFVYSLVPQTINLQGDSVSNKIFELLYGATKAQGDVYRLDATVAFPSLGLLYTLTNGTMKTYSPMSNAKKYLQPRAYGLVWESVTPGVPL